jgi:uncharacterized protein (TIGR03086 family)
VLTTVDVRDLYARCSGGFVERVNAVGERWADPSPLPGWDVRALVNHLVNEERWMPLLFGGATIDDVGDRLDGDLLGDDPVATVDEAAARALGDVRAEGALEGTVQLSFGARPGREYAVQVAADHLVHTWDLARALGTEATLDEDAVTAVLDWFDGVETRYREAGVIGPRVDVASGAGPQAQLLGRFGRQP